MEHFVTLDRIPSGLEFPPEFRDRILLDASRNRLVYRGFMSKSEFDRLCSLSEDWSYRRPLEELFRKCGSEEPASRSGVRRMLTSLAALLPH